MTSSPWSSRTASSASAKPPRRGTARKSRRPKLRPDSREAALEGGKNGPALVAGDGARSELVRRISLPKTDDDFMPIAGEPLWKEQIAQIKKWIDDGAVWLETATPNRLLPPEPEPDPDPEPVRSDNRG